MHPAHRFFPESALPPSDLAFSDSLIIILLPLLRIIMALAPISSKKPYKKAALKQKLPDFPKDIELSAVKWVDNN